MKKKRIGSGREEKVPDIVHPYCKNNGTINSDFSADEEGTSKVRFGHFSLPALRIYIPSLLKLMNLWSLIVKLSVLVVLVTSFLILHNN